MATWWVAVEAAGIFLVLEGAWPSPVRVQFSPQGAPFSVCVADVCSASHSPLQGRFFRGDGWSLLWALLPYTESSMYMLNHWIISYKNSHLFYIIVNSHCKIIQKVLMYISHSVLSITGSSFIQQIPLALLLSSRHGSSSWQCRREKRPISAFTTLTRQSRRQTVSKEQTPDVR